MAESKWYQLWRDFQDNSLLSYVLNMYSHFMEIRRYSSFPFYIYPLAKSGNQSLQEKVITFFDYLIDAHESEHTGWESKRHNMYTRARFVWRKFWLYSNDTMYNLFFFSTFSRAQQDQLTQKMRMLNLMLYLDMTILHSFSLALLCWRLRMRTVSKSATLAISVLYYFYFKLTYQLEYTFVDRQINKEAARLGLGYYVQPAYTHRPRNIEY